MPALDFQQLLSETFGRASLPPPQLQHDSPLYLWTRARCSARQYRRAAPTDVFVVHVDTSFEAFWCSIIVGTLRQQQSIPSPFASGSPPTPGPPYPNRSWINPSLRPQSTPTAAPPGSTAVTLTTTPRLPTPSPAHVATTDYTLTFVDLNTGGRPVSARSLHSRSSRSPVAAPPTPAANPKAPTASDRGIPAVSSCPPPSTGRNTAASPSSPPQRLRCLHRSPANVGPVYVRPPPRQSRRNSTTDFPPTRRPTLHGSIHRQNRSRYERSAPQATTSARDRPGLSNLVTVKWISPAMSDHQLLEHLRNAGLFIPAGTHVHPGFRRARVLRLPRPSDVAHLLATKGALLRGTSISINPARTSRRLSYSEKQAILSCTADLQH